MSSPAYADGESYTFVDVNTITASGGDFFGTKTVQLKREGNTNRFVGTFTRNTPTGGVANTTVTLTLTSRNTGATGFSATVVTTSVVLGCNPDSSPFGCSEELNEGVGVVDPTAVGKMIENPTESDPEEETKKNASDDCPIAETTDFRWAMCPIFWAMSAFTNTLDAFINSYLSTGNDIFGENKDSYHKGWETFRNMGIGLVVIAGLIMLMSEALGLSIVDAYTVRKVLPRLLVAIIGISISWELCKFLIGLFDDLGQAMGSIIYTSFGVGDEGIEVMSLILSQLLVTGSAALAAIVLTGMGVLSLLGTLILAMLVAAIALVLRQAIIVAAVMLAPLAIAAYILPNTAKLANFWWDTLIRMLILYPVATGLIALCKVLGKITMTNPSGAGGPIGSLIATTSGIVLFFVGYALIPVAMRLTGGAVATLGGLANDRSRGAFDGLKNYRKGKSDRSKELLGRRVLQKRGAMTSKLQTMASGGLDSDYAKRTGNRTRSRAAGNFALRRLAGAVGGENVEAQMSARRAAVAKEVDDQIASGDDTEVRALTVNKAWADKYGEENVDKRTSKDGKREYKTLGGAWVGESQVMRAQQRWGKDTFAHQAALSYEMRKASTEEEIQGIATNYRRVSQGIGKDSKGVLRRAGGWGNSDYAAGGNWIGSAFANQGKHLEYKRVNWRTGDMSSITSGDKVTDSTVVMQGNNLVSGASIAGGPAGKQYETFDTGRSGQYVNEIYENKGSYPLAQMNSNSIEQLKRAHQATSVIIANSSDAAVKAAALDQQRKIGSIVEGFMSEMGSGVPRPNDGAGEGQGMLDIPMQRQGGGNTRQLNSAGSGHFTERLYELAALTGGLTHAAGSHPSDTYANYDPAVHGTATPNSPKQR